MDHSTGEIMAAAAVIVATGEVAGGVAEGVGEAGDGVAEDGRLKAGKADTRLAREDYHEASGLASSVRMGPEVKNGALTLRLPLARMVLAQPHEAHVAAPRHGLKVRKQ